MGLALVVFFMFAAYGLFGLFANIALLVNIALIFGVLSLLGATLTLPGIAGIVLTIGIAVDANVLINERIREEIRTGKSPMASIQAGYTRALTTIIDSNVTTLISTLVLFWLGSGPVRGFAVTLSVGILTSMFTAVMVTRMMVGTDTNTDKLIGISIPTRLSDCYHLVKILTRFPPFSLRLSADPSSLPSSRSSSKTFRSHTL